MTNLNHKTSNGGTISSFAYTLDKVGNRLSKAEPNGKTNYNYNTIYQLLQAQPSQLHGRHKEQSEEYCYDPLGNRLSGPEKHVTYIYGPGNELLKKGQSEYIYDKNGNLNVMDHQRHNEGQSSELHDHDSRQWTYSYDFENRLIKAETKHENETITVTFKYDPFGRRIEKRTETVEHGKAEESTLHSYVYDGQAIILDYETKQDKDHFKSAETTTTKYVHGPNIDEPLAMTRDNEVFFYHANGLGSIVALTDKRQRVIEIYKYDSFGNIEARDSRLIQPFTYTGRSGIRKQVSTITAQDTMIQWKEGS